jgi:hypothetical protein
LYGGEASLITVLPTEPRISVLLGDPDNKNLQIVYTSPMFIVDGITWQQIIRAHIQKVSPKLESRLDYSSNALYFVASSSQITYLRQLAAMIHTLMKDIDRIHKLIQEIGREDVLRMLPVRNLSGPGCTIGIKHPETNRMQTTVASPTPEECNISKDEIERLAQLAYETYMAHAYNDGSSFSWEKLNHVHQQAHWRACAKVVANNVLQSVKLEKRMFVSIYSNVDNEA